jgi:FkbM family methyltransferase
MNKIKKIGFWGIQKTIRSLLNHFSESDKAHFLSEILANIPPEISVRTKLGDLKFYCLGRIPIYRATSFFSKEPETLEWIESFEENSVMWDIGANVGIYSLYASLKPEVQVVSFEPAGNNYFLLSKNIELNRLDSKISAYCIAMSDSSTLDDLNMSNTELGGAFQSFGKSIDHFGKPFSPVFRHAAVGFSIDDFISQFSVPFPTYIKIDVDSIESEIIKGAEKTLRDKRLKSILIELDTSRVEYFEKVVEMIDSAGLDLKSVNKCPEAKVGIELPSNCIFSREE